MRREEFGCWGGGRAWHTLACPAAAAVGTSKATHSATSIQVSIRARAPPRGWRPRQRLPPPSIANSAFGLLRGWCPADSSLPPAPPPARAAGDVMNQGYRRRAFNDAVMRAVEYGTPNRTLSVAVVARSPFFLDAVNSLLLADEARPRPAGRIGFRFHAPGFALGPTATDRPCSSVIGRHDREIFTIKPRFCGLGRYSRTPDAARVPYRPSKWPLSAPPRPSSPPAPRSSGALPSPPLASPLADQQSYFSRLDLARLLLLTVVTNAC